MPLRTVLRKVGLAVAALGLGAGLLMMVGGCAGIQEGMTEPESPNDPQTTEQGRFPALDLDAPRDFQTAAFALG